MKPEVPFRNRKYLFKSGSSVKNHDFQLSNMFWRALRVKTLESDFKFQADIEPSKVSKVHIVRYTILSICVGCRAACVGESNCVLWQVRNSQCWKGIPTKCLSFQGSNSRKSHYKKHYLKSSGKYVRSWPRSPKLNHTFPHNSTNN